MSELPWRRFMEIAFGVLGIPPSEFYAMTLPELGAATAGWQEAHGARPEGERAPSDPVKRAEHRAAKALGEVARAKMAARKARRRRGRRR